MVMTFLESKSEIWADRGNLWKSNNHRHIVDLPENNSLDKDRSIHIGSSSVDDIGHSEDID
jgi:hypothetical protein